MKIVSNSPQETKEFGLKLAKKLKNGCLFSLIGDLGGGKTELTKGLIKGMGVGRQIVSPTFVLMRVYRVRRRHIRFFCHVDAYRLKRLEDIIDVGLLEFLGRPDSVVVVEWADKIKPLLWPFAQTIVRFSFINKNKRRITISKKHPSLRGRHSS